MLSDWEIWACANRMVRQHGFDAPIHAAMRADELLEEGDLAGSLMCRQIMHRIEKLLKKPDGELN